MKFILLTHSQEILKQTNTGRLAQDILGASVEVIIWQRKNPDKELLTLLSTQRAALLFPEDDSSPGKGKCDTGQVDRISPQVVNVLRSETINAYEYYVILDATWQQAHKIYKQSPYLQLAEKVAIRVEHESSYRRRRNQRKGGLCTIECIIELLVLQGASAEFLQLREAYEAFNEQMN
jgi:tRNA-uridine aminocarboxypropyltransferase